MPRSSKWHLPFSFSDQNSLAILIYSTHATWPGHYSLAVFINLILYLVPAKSWSSFLCNFPSPVFPSWNLPVTECSKTTQLSQFITGTEHLAKQIFLMFIWMQEDAICCLTCHHIGRVCIQTSHQHLITIDWETVKSLPKCITCTIHTSTTRYSFKPLSTRTGILYIIPIFCFDIVRASLHGWKWTYLVICDLLALKDYYVYFRITMFTLHQSTIC